MSLLHEAVAARAIFVSRFGSDPRIREVGVGPSRARRGYCVQVTLARPTPDLPAGVDGVEVEYEVGPARHHAGIPRWAWLGSAKVFDVLDANRDGFVDRRGGFAAGHGDAVAGENLLALILE